MKRIIAFLLVAALTVGLCSVSVGAASYDEKTYKLTGFQAKDIVGIAKTQVGLVEGYMNITKYGDWYNSYIAWCGVFVSWCAEKAGIPKSVIPKEGDLHVMLQSFKNMGLWKTKTGYTPKQGDIVFFKWGLSASADLNTVLPDHVGIVEKVNSDGTIQVIDGNYGDKVCYRASPRNIIIGYATPKYTVPTPKDVNAYYKVVTTGVNLNVRAGYSTDNAIVTSLPNNTVFHISKTMQNGSITWGYVDSIAIKGWCALSYATFLYDPTVEKYKMNTVRLPLVVGEIFNVSADIPSAVRPTTKWSSKNAGVASVDAAGKVTAYAAGGTEIILNTILGSFTCAVSVRAGDVTYKKGDLDYDGVVDVSDIVEIRTVILTKSTLPSSHVQNGDLDGDGAVDVSDVVALRSIILGKDL